MTNHTGWAGYLQQGIFLCKRFTPLNRPLPRWWIEHRNFHLIIKFTELETLGPLVRLLPGEAVSHVEEWQVYQQPRPA